MARKRSKDDEQDPIHRENVPGELDHASGQVEQFEAALVSGADGEEAELASEDELIRQSDAATPGSVAVRGKRWPRADPRGPHRPLPVVRQGVVGRAAARAVARPPQVGQATAVVLGFVVIAGAYLGLADAVAQRFVDLIL
jgi:hypothetical protein